MNGLAHGKGAHYCKKGSILYEGDFAMINLKVLAKKFLIMVIIILVNFWMDIKMEKEQYIEKMALFYIKEILLMIIINQNV